MTRRGRSALWLAIAAAGCVACGAGHPNLVLVTLDAVRTDHLGSYGAEDARTPTLDRLARRGVVFERAFASTPLTLPSHTTLLTGLDPREHGVHDDARFRAREDLPAVAVALLERGYATAAFVGGWSLHRSFGLARGFALYDDEIPPPRDPLAFDDARRSAREVTDRALAWLAGRARAPFFIWVHYADARAPRRPAPPFDRDPDRYRGALSSADAEIGRLLDGIERRGGDRATLVVAVAAYAESFGEHEEWGHGTLVHDAVLHVPLIVSGPGFTAGTRSRAFVRTENVAPTLLRAAGAPGAARTLQDVAGRSGLDADDAPVWFESRAGSTRRGWAPLEGVRTSRWKLVARPGPAVLTDLLDDPGEERDVSALHPEVVARLSQAWRQLTDAAPAAARETAAERDERVALSGYLPGPPLEPTHEDPRDVVQALVWVERAAAAAAGGRIDDGIRSLEALGRSPRIRPLVLPWLGSILMRAERPGEAARVYEELVAQTGDGYARVSLAAARLAAGDAGRAVAEIDALEAERGVLSPRARVMRGFGSLALARPQEALSDAERVLERDADHEAALALASSARASLQGEDDEIRRLEQRLAESEASGSPQTRLALAELLARAGRDADAAAVLDAAPHPDPELMVARAAIAARHDNIGHAVRLYEEALRLRPLSRHFHRELASLYAEQGRYPEAVRLYDELLAGRPDDAGLLAARATALVRAGHPDEAEPSLRSALELDDGLAEAWYQLALIELEDGRETEAEAHLRRVVELRPGFSGAHLQLARLYHRRGDPRSAEQADLAVRASAPGASGTGGTDSAATPD